MHIEDENHRRQELHAEMLTKALCRALLWRDFTERLDEDSILRFDPR